MLCAFIFIAQHAYPAEGVVFKKPRPQRDMSGIEKRPEYVYNPEGKIDPFVPFTLKQRKGQNATEWQLPTIESLLNIVKKPKTDLQKLDLATLELTAIVKNEDKIWAMVNDSKGKGYLIEKGTYIGQKYGVVEDIVVEDKEGTFGLETVRKIIIKEPIVNPQTGKIDYKFIEKYIDLKSVK